MRTQQMYSSLIGRLEGDGRIDAIAHRVDRASASLGDGGVVQALRGDWLGHAAHPLMTDFPLGCWMSAGLLDLLGGRSARTAAQRLVGAGLLAVPATAMTGLADYRSVPDRGTRRVGAVHAVGNTVVAGLYFMSWRRRRAGAHAAGVVLGLAGGTLAWATGYLGGHMSFARGTGVGSRGTLDAGNGHDDLIGVEEAADLLTVPIDQVHDMVAEGMLTPVGGADSVLFAMSEVLAARQIGG